jgi:hypothetical protein
VSGVVAVQMRRGGAELGRQALDLLRHHDEWEVAEVAAGGTWLGAAGRRGTIDAAHDGEDPRVAAVVCGRVVNLAEVAGLLGLPPGPPARLFLAAYSRWGRRGLERFAGAYAFILADDPRGLTVAGTDPTGIFRQHGVRLGDDVLLASEAKAFLVHPRFHAAVDPLTAGELLAVGYVLDGRSLFESVLATPHGSWLEVENGRPGVVRRWDIRADLGRGRWGAPYHAVLAEAAREVTAEAFAGGGQDPPLLPITGGLDSRLLAAAAPRGALARTVTFGLKTEPDVVLGGRIAAARGWEHRIEPLQQDYLQRHAAATVWVTEGRLNPMSNLTGFLMPRVARHDGFLSGTGGEVGRHQWKAHALWQDWALLEAGDAGFEQRLRGHLYESSLRGDDLRRLAGPRLRGGVDAAAGELDRVLAFTRGLEPVDRVDLYIAMQRIREFTLPGLLLSELFIDVLAPFLTRRWTGAVLSGAPAQRRDDIMRLRLIRSLDPRVAAVPWALTRLPSRSSAAAVAGLRAASLAAYRLSARRADEDMKVAPRRGGSARARGPAANAALGLAGAVKRRIYSHGERRDDWLRHEAGAFLQQTLLAAPAAGPLLDPAATADLIRAHLAGADHALLLGQLVNLQLWMRLFEEQDEGLRRDVRRHLCRRDEAPDPADDTVIHVA